MLKIIFIQNSRFRIYSGTSFNPIALRKAKIAYNFGLSECKRVIDW